MRRPIGRSIRPRPLVVLTVVMVVVTAIIMGWGPAGSAALAGGPPDRAAGVNGAVGPFDDYCDGYGNPGASGLGYISALKLEVGLAQADLDEVLDGIVAYDRAETSGTYIGQINMLTASSFNGLNGAVWGYHLARADELAGGGPKPLFMADMGGGQIPVYSMEPLLDAAQGLVGTVKHRRFPCLPGAQVICAVKSKTVPGPDTVWCAAALAIAEDRTKAANLFIEDVGAGAPAEGPARRAFIDRLYKNIVQSVIRCGEDNGVTYKEIFIGHRLLDVPAGGVGCALTCAPYLVLAKKAIPPGAKPADLLKMSLGEWEKAVGLAAD